MEAQQLNKKNLSLRLSLQKLVGHLYFFFNSVGLKGGLLYTNLLTPFFLVWIYKKGFSKTLLYSILVILPFSIANFINGVELKSFFISHVVFISTIVFVISTYIYISQYQSLKALMREILIINFILVLIAIPFYFAPYQYQKIFWYSNLFTSHKEFTRLALFTFEASYYSLLMVPIVYYYFFRTSFNSQIISGRLILFMAFFPLLLSMSFGVLGATALTAFIMIWVNRKQLITNHSFFIITFFISILFVLSVCFLLLFFSDSLLITRIWNIVNGYDTSTRGRTFESFQIAWKAVNMKSIWFGCGLGQTKFLLPDIIHTYFSHWGKQEVYRIPNAIAENLAVFGITGLMVRFSLIFYFFKKTNVNKNHFRLSLFLFAFIYQFTGSYITNVVEYTIWIFAFTDIFPEFDVNKKGINHSNQN